MIDYIDNYVASIDECRINYCWYKFCLKLASDVKTSEVNSRVPGNRNGFAPPQASSAFQSLFPPVVKCPFIQKFTVFV